MGRAALAADGGAARPAAVLWDLDGTLVDSAALWRPAYQRLAEDLGGRCTDETWERMVGRTLADSVLVLCAAPGLEAGNEPDHGTVDDLVGRLLAHARSLLAERDDLVRWRPGAPAALASVRATGTPMGVVTTTWRSLAEPMLGTVVDDLDVLVCGDEVTAGKPAPEAYLRAAASLGVDAADCLAVEDSPSGVTAARRAGMRVVAVPSGPAVPQGPGIEVRDSLVGWTFDA